MANSNNKYNVVLLWEQGVAQWRERWPPNNVALVQIPVSTPRVG